MHIESPENFRVYQRNENNLCNVEIKLSGDSSFKVFCSYQDKREKIIFKDKVFSLSNLAPGEYRISLYTEDESEKIQEIIFFVGDLWVLGGQSNMKGFGKLTDLEVSQKGVSCFYMDNKWDLAKEPLVWLNDSPDSIYHTIEKQSPEYSPQTERFMRTQGAGLGLAFGKKVLEETAIPIGLIPCAKGSTNMDAWNPDDKYNLYDAMLNRINLVGGKIAGILWYQGESDAIDNISESYLNKTVNMFQKLRKDLEHENLPIIAAQISVTYDNSINADNWNRVQAMQLELEERLDFCRVTPTIDAVLSDLVHLDAKSLAELGRRMALNALSMLYKKSCEKGPRLKSFRWNDEHSVLTLLFSDCNGGLQNINEIKGFSIFDGENSLYFQTRLKDSHSVELIFEKEMINPLILYHGKGLNPLVNLKDEFDFPLPVFGPIDL